MENKSIHQILVSIQSELVAPKNQFNKFGNFKYRSCEDILEALKPLLLKYNATVTISDEIVQVGDRFYVKAVATFISDRESHNAIAYAREPQEKKGMDSSQITGATSSYARKYALNGLFLIDDAKDADAHNSECQKEYITDKQLGIIRDTLIILNKSEEKFCSYMGIDNLEKMKLEDYSKAISALESAKNKVIK